MHTSPLSVPETDDSRKHRPPELVSLEKGLLLRKAKPGMSAAALNKLVAPYYRPLQKEDSIYSFSKVLPAGVIANVEVFQLRDLTNTEEFLVAVYRSPKKTSLIDLFSVAPSSVYPHLNGQYNQNLAKIKHGDDVLEMFRLLGHRDADYFKEGDRWRVRFLYIGWRGRFIEITADAATGKVLKVEDATI